jgi:ABC-type Fe3+-hydroxamate transport system substrate-binding protein
MQSLAQQRKVHRVASLGPSCDFNLLVEKTLKLRLGVIPRGVVSNLTINGFDSGVQRVFVN